MNRNYERHTDWSRPLSAQVAHADDPHTPTEAELIDIWAEPTPDQAAFDRTDLWPEGGER